MKKVTEMTKQEYADYIENKQEEEIEHYKERIAHWLELDFNRFMLDSLSKNQLRTLYLSVEKSVFHQRRLEARIKELENKMEEK